MVGDTNWIFMRYESRASFLMKHEIIMRSFGNLMFCEQNQTCHNLFHKIIHLNLDYEKKEK